MPAHRVLTFVQFVIIAIGLATNVILSKTEDQAVEPGLFENITNLLAAHGLWVFIIPLLWVAFIGAAERKVPEKVLTIISGGITFLVLLLVGVPLIYRLG